MLFSGSLMYDKACFACLDFKYIFIGEKKKRGLLINFDVFFLERKQTFGGG